MQLHRVGNCFTRTFAAAPHMDGDRIDGNRLPRPAATVRCMARSAAPGTRERIVAAVLPLFDRHGVRAVGTAQVVAAAGCGKNLLYRHFPGKSDLAAAYLTAVRERWEHATDRAVAAASTPRDRLLAVVEDLAARVRDPAFRGCAMRIHLREFPGVDDAATRIAHGWLECERERVARLAAAAGAPPETGGRVRLVLEALYAAAGRPDAAEQADVAVGLAHALLPRP